MRDDEGGAAAAQGFETVLNQRFAFAVEARRSLRRESKCAAGASRARAMGDALALAAGEFHAAFADDGFVAFLEFVDEFFAVRQPAGGADFVHRRVGAREADVVGDAAVEEKIVRKTTPRCER